MTFLAKCEEEFFYASVSKYEKIIVKDNFSITFINIPACPCLIGGGDCDGYGDSCKGKLQPVS